MISLLFYNKWCVVRKRGLRSRTKMAEILQIYRLYSTGNLGTIARMKFTGLSLALLISSNLLLVSCGPRDRGNATPEAAHELALISEYLPECNIDEMLELPAGDEIHLLMGDFAATANARLLSRPSGVSMLHLASLFKKPELARCLLIDHADPNAATAMGDTPLGLAVSMRGAEDSETNADTIIKLIDVLVAAGADTQRNIMPDDLPLLDYAGLNCYSEKVFLHLLDLNCPICDTTPQGPAMMGWNTALKQLLDKGAVKSQVTMNILILQAAANLHCDTVEVLLNAGADVNAQHISGTTPLLEAAGHLLSPAEEKEEAHRKAILDTCALLIKRGADPYLSEVSHEGSPAFCAADILTKDAETIAAMKERGVNLETPEIKFTPGVELLEQIGKATIMERIPPADAFDTIASVLTPTEEMKQQAQYHEVLPMAVELLHTIDPARASRHIASLPVWTSEEAWNTHFGDHLLPALTACEQLILPKQLICLAAEHLNKAGKVDNAASMIELLHRCPDADAEIARYCTHEARPLRAGAMAARLRRACLPTPRDGDVQFWLDNNSRTPDTPELQKALLLTSLSRLWFGDMLPAEQEKMLRAMEEIGATEAASHYRAIVAAMDNPEKLDTLTENSDSWKFELEIATAEYILQHSAAFLAPQKEITD